MPPRIVTLAALLLAPVAAHAALVVDIEQKELAPAGEDRVVYLDVYLQDPDGRNENLRAFRVSVTGPQNAASGVRFYAPATFTMPRTSAAHPWVFEHGLDSPFPIPTTFDRTGGFYSGEDNPVDVSPTLNGLLGIPVLIPANTPAGVYTFPLDPAGTILSSTAYATPGDARVAPIPFTTGQPGRITVTPEPASAAVLLSLPACLLLRRRRA